jgi:repressor LexA
MFIGGETYILRKLNQLTLDSMEKFIKDYQIENGSSPSYRKIMHALKMSSLNLVQTYVLALEEQGRIQRTELGNIHLPPKLNTGETVCVPLVGQIACGVPTFAEEHIESIFTLPKDIFGNGKLFMLKAFGNSMIDVGIDDGDLLVIKQQSTANDGEIVVALVDDEATLKRIYHKGNKIILHPENKEMEDIVVTECQVQGVLVSCIKRY